MRILKSSAALALAFALAPTAAFAVNVSSNDGSGQQGVAEWYVNGARLTGTLKSTHGNPVYFAGHVIYDWAPDKTVGRYTTNTSSTSGASRGGIVADRNGADGVRVRICRDRNNLPDPCGDYSSDMKN